jgi:hypothetical protein
MSHRNFHKSVNTQDVAGYPLGKIMRCVIPKATEQQGVPVYAYYQKIAISSLRAFHNCLYFVPFDKFRRQRYALLTSSFLCSGLKLSIILRSLLLKHCGPAWDFGVYIATVWRQPFLYRHGSQFGVQALGETDAGE